MSRDVISLPASRDLQAIADYFAGENVEAGERLLYGFNQKVHFSGHGSGSSGLALENNSGQMQLVSTESLASLFKLFQNKIECVLLKNN